LASTYKLKKLGLIEFDRLVEQARAERWEQITLLGRVVELEGSVEHWPDALRAAEQIFQFRATVEGLAGKLRLLSGLTSVDLSGNNNGAEVAKAIGASLPCLTSLDLSDNNIGAERRNADETVNVDDALDDRIAIVAPPARARFSRQKG
jgi:hypothetical protein